MSVGVVDYASEQVMNSALRVDLTMRLCFRDCHEIASVLERNTSPPRDLRSALLLAQLESEYPAKPLPMPMPMPMACRSNVVENGFSI